MAGLPVTKIPPSGFDDPDDKGQKKIPGLDSSFQNYVNQNLKPYNAKFSKALNDFIATNTEITNEMQAFMLHGFIAETGLKPSECMMIVGQDKTTFTYSFEAKAAARLGQQRIAELESQVKKMRDEIYHLRSKR